jgi:hypothetical protein
MPVHLHCGTTVPAGIAQPVAAIEAIFLPLSILRAARAVDQIARSVIEAPFATGARHLHLV